MLYWKIHREIQLEYGRTNNPNYLSFYLTNYNNLHSLLDSYNLPNHNYNTDCIKAQYVHMKKEPFP